MRIAIIGGGGKMGQWFADFLSREGHDVVISGRTESKLLEAKRRLGVEVASNVAALEGADVMLLSVPIENFADVVREIGPHVTPGQIVIDNTSIKVRPVEIMHQHLKTGRILGAHPLFGPGARGVANQNFVLTPTGDEERDLASKVREYLEGRGANVSLMTPQEHDQLMAVVLGLAHFIAIVAGDTMLSADRPRPLEALGGITYKVLLTLVESVISENPELYASLQMNLPGITEIEALFQQKARDWAELVASRDREKFVQQMKVLKEKLEKGNPDFGKAYHNMYRLAAGR
jgi:prephenate dehydrogenase